MTSLLSLRHARRPDQPLETALTTPGRQAPALTDVEEHEARVARAHRRVVRLARILERTPFDREALEGMRVYLTADASAALASFSVLCAHPVDGLDDRSRDLVERFGARPTTPQPAFPTQQVGDAGVTGLDEDELRIASAYRRITTLARRLMLDPFDEQALEAMQLCLAVEASPALDAFEALRSLGKDVLRRRSQTLLLGLGTWPRAAPGCAPSGRGHRAAVQGSGERR